MNKKNRKFFLLMLLLISAVIMPINIIFNNITTDKGNNKVDPKTSEYVNPIEIDGDATGIGAKNWTWAKNQPWCSGNGTWADPYIIEDAIIDAEGTGNCISINNSNVYFTIKYCTVFNSGVNFFDAGIRLENTNNGTIINNNCSKNFIGIYATYCNNNTYSENIANENTYIGILLNEDCSDNEISGNTVYMNTEGGISIAKDSNNNEISGNEVNNNGIGGGGDAGISIVDSCNYNNITENIVSDNNIYGIYMWSSMENLFYMNYFFDNQLHAYCDDPIFPTNTTQWDNSKIGNYWDNYTGVDSNEDGIGDTPYTYIPGDAEANDTLPIYGNPFLTIINVSSTNANGTYRWGDTIEITIEFSDTVYVTGLPQLTLETGDDDAIVDYTNGNATKTLSFNYTVGLNHFSLDLNYSSSNALDLNGGTIKGIIGNNADLTLPDPGDPGSLSYNKDILVDAITPSVNNVSSTNLNGIYTDDEEINITITFSVVVYVTGLPQLTLETGDDDAIVDYTAGNETDTLTFNYTVVSGHTSSDLDYVDENALTGTIKDLEGLAADLSLPIPGTLGSLSYNKEIIIDTEDPTGSITINNGDAWATSTSVTLTLIYSDTASGVDQVRYSNDGTSWTPWEDPSGTRSWILTSGDETKTVYYEIRDNAGLTNQYTDTIGLDTADPTGSITINGGDAWTTSTSVSLTLIASDATSGVDQVRFSNDGGSWSAWEVLSSPRAWILTTGDGTKTVYYEIRDNVGYINQYTDTIGLDTADPTGSITINGGDAWTTSTSVSLTLIASDATSGVDQVRFSNDGGSWSAWEVLSSPRTWILTTGDGTKTVYYEIRDNVGYINQYTDTIGLDTEDPTILNVNSPIANGTYGIGAIIDITITFSEPVYLTDIPQLTLETGSTDAIIYYTSGNETDTLTFTYTVVSDHSSPDLDYFSKDALIGTIKDYVGNNADLTLPALGTLGSLGYNKDIIIETTSPEILNVTSNNPDGTYGIGEIISITITFSEPVYITNTPQLTLETGSIDAVIDYTGGSGTNTLIFTYTVASGHNSDDLEYISVNALSGTIRDLAGNDANMTLPALGALGSLSDNKDIIIDAIAPIVSTVSSSKPDGTYGVGENISIIITFSDPVYVTGTPQLTLETGSIDAVIGYTSGSGTNTLIFTYTVASGHDSDDLDYGSVNALSLNGGSIKDTAGNDAVLTLPTPGGIGSLSFDKDIIIHTPTPQGDDNLITIIVIGSSAGVVVSVIAIILIRKRRKKW